MLKLRDFSTGEYPDDVARLETHGVPRSWLEGASELADRINKSYATQDMTPIILHGRIAEALYAVMILSYSDGWAVSDRYRLWTGLGGYLGFGPGKDALLRDQLNAAREKAASKQEDEERGLIDPSEFG